MPKDENTASVIEVGQENFVGLPPYNRTELVFKHDRIGEFLNTGLTRADIWDAEWQQGYWLMNVMKYAGSKAQVVDIKVSYQYNTY